MARIIMLNLFRCDSISTNTLYTGYLLTYSLTHSQSANHLLGQDSRPFRQVQVIKNAITTITAITATMAITAATANMAITAITAILAIKGIIIIISYKVKHI